jgi:hypothetical protein
MIAYTETEYGLFSWPITTATPTPAAAVLALSSVRLVVNCAQQLRVEKPALRSAIANPMSDLSGQFGGSGSRANAWGFV